jgi:hypothetical protein
MTSIIIFNIMLRRGLLYNPANAYWAGMFEPYKKYSWAQPIIDRVDDAVASMEAFPKKMSEYAAEGPLDMAWGAKLTLPMIYTDATLFWETMKEDQGY